MENARNDLRGTLNQWPVIQDCQKYRLRGSKLDVIRFLNILITEALRVRATDLHFQASGMLPWNDNARAHLRILMRIDGQIHPVAELFGREARHVCSRVKVLSNMDLGRPTFQEGRLIHDPQDPGLDIRATVVPAGDGEHIALRLLRQSMLLQSLDELGMTPFDLIRLRGILERESGLVLVVGPAGAGKTTSIHAFLREAPFQNRNVITIEDPVEARLSEATQINLDRRAGQTFDQILVSVLRMDPDAIMVGELRTPEAARAAAYAATTGKFVFSTLHSRRASEAVDALKLRGVSEQETASTLKGVVCQRLVRKLCPCCAALVHSTPEIASLFASCEVPLPKGELAMAKGCSACFETGYLGRTGVFELIEINAPLRKAIREGAGPEEIESLARRQGGASLLSSGLEKVARRVTSLEEVLGMNASGESEIPVGMRLPFIPEDDILDDPLRSRMDQPLTG